ncbi:MAG: hypothetical protein ACU85V_06495 [Gammaproteobacteria bacterium]
MSQIAQVQITFNAAEDRLLLRLSTQAGEEFRFWLTRRFVAALRPHLGSSLSEQPRIKTQASPEARRELLRFEHEKAVGNADFATPFQEAAKSLPLGDAPILLTRFQLRPQPDDQVVLAMGPEQGNGIDVKLNPTLLHSIVALLDKALAAADWALPTTAEAAAPSGEVPPSAVN